MRLLRAISGGPTRNSKKNKGGGGDSSIRRESSGADSSSKRGGRRRGGWGRKSSAGASSIAEDSLADANGSGNAPQAAAAADNEASMTSLSASASASASARVATPGTPAPTFHLSQNATIQYHQSMSAIGQDRGARPPLENLVVVDFGDDESFDEEDLGVVSNSTLRYLPQIVRVSYSVPVGSGRHLAKPPIRSLPEYDDFQASVLILDLSGFTALGERLVQEHGASEGAARLAQSVDRILSAMVLCVYEYGGDVLRFAGDALICLFQDFEDHNEHLRRGSDIDGFDERDQYEERRRSSLLRVRECCLQVLGQVAFLSEKEGAIFTIHGGAAYGPVRRFYLGMLSPHPGDCTYLVAGTPLRKAGKLLDMAGASEILMLGMNFLDEEKPTHGPFRITEEDGVKFYRENMKMSSRRFSQTHEGRADVHIHARAYLGTLAARLCDRAEGAMSLLHNELRPVAVIFVGLHDLDEMQPDLLRRASMGFTNKYKEADMELLRLMNDTFLTLRRITHNCHGAVMNMLFDDKGCIFISTFGANSHDHDPRFDACMCAMRMKEALSSLGMNRFQLGVSYGDCFCGQVGPAERADFAVLGAEVNMSARLMGKADPGGVLVSKRVYQASRKHIEFEKSDKIQVKGKDGSFHAYSPQARINRVRSKGSLRTLSVQGGSSKKLLSAEKPFLLMPSREASMNTLLEALQSADDGMPEIAFITGGPFLGKSSMVRQLCDSAVGSGFSVLRSFRTSLDAFTSYFPFRQIAETAMQKCAVRILGEKPLEEDNDSVEEDRDLMNALMLLISREVLSKTDRAILGSILPDVTDSQLMSLLKGLSPEALTKAIVDSLMKVFRLLQPLVMVFEGDGDIDPASWEVLKALMERAPDECPQLMLMVLSRNELNMPESVAHFKEVGAQVELKPFDRFETMVYLKLLLGIHEQEDIEIDETMLDTVHDRANGCPLYVEYIVTWALERRMIEQDEESQKMKLLHDDSEEETAIPRELSNIVLAAFNNLTPTLWDALKIASCIGYSFDAKVYKELTQTMDLMPKVEELANFYDAFELSLDSNTYKWKHQAVFEAVKSLLIKNQTVQIHGMIAEGYEKDQGTITPELLLDAGTHRLLARHFLLAEKWEGAFDQYMEAGNQAEDTFNYPEAAKMYEEAIICQGKLAFRPALSSRLLPTIKLGNCLRELARYQESEAVLTRCLKEVESEMSQQKCPDTEQMYVLALTALATLHQNQSKYHKARELYEKALPVARAVEGQSSSLWLASHIGGYAEILRKSGELESAEKLHREALEMKEENSCTELELAVSYTQLGCTLIGLGQAEEAYEKHRSALLLRFKYLGFSHGLVSESLNYCAEALSKLGRSEEGIPLAMHCVSIRKQVFGTSHPAFAHALSILASCYDTVGRYSNAKGLLERCLEICEDAFPKNHANIISNLMNYGRVLRSMGNYEEARDIYERAVTVHRINFKEGQKQVQLETCLNQIKEIAEDMKKEIVGTNQIQSEADRVLQFVTNRTVDVADGTPIIILTDIGRDVDDEYALMLLGALTRKQLVNPLAVVTTLSPSTKRAALSKGSLDALGLLHVPVGIGSAGGVEDGRELEVYESAYRRTSASIFEDGIELIVLSLMSAPDKSVRLLCLASMSDYATLIRKHEDLFVSKVKEVVVMGGLEPLDCHDTLQPDTAYNNKCDLDSAKYVYQRCQELKVPTVTLSRWAVYGCPVSNELFDELCKTDHMVATNLRRVSMTSINELWRKVNLPFPHPGREKLPERCNRKWFCETFFGKEDVKRNGTASIWDLVTKLFMYDPLAMLCCVDEFRHEFFRWTTKEVNGIVHHFVGVSESNNGIVDAKCLCSKLSYLFRFSLRESLQNIEEACKQ